MRESDPLALYSTSNKAFSRLCFIFLACALSLFVLACSDERDIPDSTYLHDGTRIHFTEQGAGTAIVFIHGFGASLVTWRLLSVHLKGDYRVILLDLKGHGHSDRRRDSRYSPEDHADVVSGLIRHLGLSRVVLVGHSFVGSTIALRLVLKGQETSHGLIRGLVLLAGALPPENLPFFLKILRVPVLGWLAVKVTSPWFRARRALEKGFYDDQKVTSALIKRDAKYLEISGTDYALRRTAERLVPQEPFRLRAELRKISVPVLYISGEHDEIVPRESSVEICKLIPRCEQQVVRGAGHLLHEERPEEAARLLQEFLQRLEPAKRGSKTVRP